MRISSEELIQILDDACAAVGEIVAAHAALSESMLDVSTSQQIAKIEALKARIARENARLAKLRNASKRRRQIDAANKRNCRRKNSSNHSLSSDGKLNERGHSQSARSAELPRYDDFGTAAVRDIDQIEEVESATVSCTKFILVTR
jgi:hypothetical protein